MSALVFMDTETTGLDMSDDIWEFAAIRREEDGTETELHLFVEHNEKKCAQLPESFRQDHISRFPACGSDLVVSRYRAAVAIQNITGGRAHIVGAVPNFDTERIAKLLADEQAPRPNWHYHLIDVENLAVGYLFGQYRSHPATSRRCQTDPATLSLPWDSNVLSKQVGVDPDRFERHTAMGDVRWAMALYDAITGADSVVKDATDG